MLRALILAAAATLAVPALAEAAKPHVDDQALRYYASLGQKDRVAAEAKRLSRLDPNWRMPADLYSSRPGAADEAPLWALYRADRLDDLAKAVALRQAAEPGWTPSDALVAKIKTKKLRAEIIALAKGGRWHEVVESFKGTGIAWAKDDAQVLWAIAEAYARENDCAEAYIVYHAILADHSDPDERRATIEFAIPLIPMAMTEKLIAMGHMDAGGRSEFEPIAIDITRARISAFLHDEPANEVTDGELRRFQDVVRDAADPHEPGLVAWYDYKRRDYSAALDWFKLAIGRGGDAMIAHGLAHTLRALDRRREAEEVAYAWREPLVNNSILFIDLLETELTKERPPFIEPERIARYAQVAMATESGEGAQALAWYAYNTCQYPMALQWFERATAWLPKEATVYGYALALQRQHRTKEFRDVVNRYDGLFPKVVGLAFDDGLRKPPPPCETTTATTQPHVEPTAYGQDGADWTGRTMADTLRPEPRPRVIAVRPLVPSPDMAAGLAGGAPRLKKRTEFPVAVGPENVLRFSSLQTIATGQGHDRTPQPWPLVARRVPGVGAMPYERWGFTLLPGYDGTREPSSPTAMEHEVAAGTLWSVEQSLRDGTYHPSPPEHADLRTSPAAQGTLAQPAGRS